MYTVKNVKKFIKEGKKNTLIYNKEQGLLCNSYMIIKVDEVVRIEIIKEFLQDESFVCRNGIITHDNINDLNSLLNNDKKRSSVDMTNFIIENDIKSKLYTRVFFNGDKQILIDKKYIDVIDIKELYTLDMYQYGIDDNANVSPIYFYDKDSYSGDDFVAMILPVRQEGDKEYMIVRSDYIKEVTA